MSEERIEMLKGKNPEAPCRTCTFLLQMCEKNGWNAEESTDMIARLADEGVLRKCRDCSQRHEGI